MADNNADNSAEQGGTDAPTDAPNARGDSAKNEQWRWSAGEELLSVGEAAERAGVHPNTVRRYLKSEGVPFFLRDMANGNVVSGSLPEEQWPARYQYLVPARVVPYLASEAGDDVGTRQIPGPGPLPATADEAVGLESDDLRASLSNAEEQLDGAAEKLAAAEEQIASLRGERDWLRLHLQNITAFLPAAKEDAETARSDLEIAREATERERERAEEIRLQGEEMTRQKDREIRARDLAVIRWQSLSWWARRGTNLEQIISEELERLSSPE